jgi:hypothetical protein
LPAHRLRLRLLSFAVGGVLLVAASELVSFVLFYAATGRRFSYATVAREQVYVQTEAVPSAAVQREAAAAAPLEAPPFPLVEGHPTRTAEDLVPHPFTGFVLNPEGPRIKQQVGRGGMEVTELGFFRIPEPSGDPQPLSIAVFGGSMAAHFCVDGREALERALAAAPAFRSRRVRIHCFALGGFKQPQTAAALLYLSTLGQRFDAVVELDGFNDVALSYDGYKKRRLFPVFPRDWDQLVTQTADPHKQLVVGKVAYLLEQRARLARWFSRRPWSWSVTAALVWKSLHRLLTSDLARAREELTLSSASSSASAEDYRTRGPARQYGNDEELFEDIAHVWGRSSLQMHRLCLGSGTRYSHFLQPNQYVAGSKPMGAAERAIAYRENVYRDPIERGYSFLRAEGVRLAAQGIDFHDLTGVFAEIQEPLYVDDCCHVSAKGSAIMGEAIGKALVARLRP